MSVLQSEVYEAFRDKGAAEDKALKAAGVLGKRDDELTTAVKEIRSTLRASKVSRSSIDGCSASSSPPTSP